MLLLCSKILIAQKISEESKIIALLEKESATWRAGDIKAHADCWLLKPYSKILVSTPAGKTLDIDPKMIIDPPKSQMGNGGTSKNSEYKISIHKKTAWVSHNEESTAADGTKTYSKEIRMLEKENKQWKLVGQSIHMYLVE